MSPLCCYRSSPHTPSRTSLLLPQTRQTFFQSACLIHFSLVWAPHEETEVTRAKGRDVRLLSLRGRRGQGLRSDILLSRYCSLGSWAGPLPSGDAHRPPRRLQTAASQPVRLCPVSAPFCVGVWRQKSSKGQATGKHPATWSHLRGCYPRCRLGCGELAFHRTDVITSASHLRFRGLERPNQ